eukprot:COSAG01_NODE_13764_length_1538_cov_2.428075_2_plen_149_part_00
MMASLKIMLLNLLFASPVLSGDVGCSGVTKGVQCNDSNGGKCMAYCGPVDTSKPLNFKFSFHGTQGDNFEMVAGMIDGSPDNPHYPDSICLGTQWKGSDNDYHVIAGHMQDSTRTVRSLYCLHCLRVTPYSVASCTQYATRCSDVHAP